MLITGYPSVQTAVEALRFAFSDYLLKRVDWLELLRSVNQAVEKARYLRMIDVAREDIDWQRTAVDHAREIANRAGTMANQTSLAWSLEAFLAQSIGNIRLLSAGIRSVVESHTRGEGERLTDVCRMMQCPRLSAYREALESTVKVREKTKSSFESKDLGLLRHKIEQLLREDP